MNYKGILIDLDNTIYDYNKAHKTALTKTIDHLAKKFSFSCIDLQKTYKKAQYVVATNLKNTAASHNRMLYFQTMLEALGVNALHHTLETYDTYWKTFLDNINPFDGIFEFLEQINSCKICIVTDLTAHIQHRKIKKLGLQKYNPLLVTSEEVGVEKPHKKMFKSALQKLQLKANDVCMIGDNFTKDIWGASQIGIDSFWLHKCDSLTHLPGNVTVFKDFKELIAHPFLHRNAAGGYIKSGYYGL